LGVMGQKLASENYYSRIDKSTANSESQSVQDVRQVVGGGIGGQPQFMGSPPEAVNEFSNLRMFCEHGGGAWCLILHIETEAIEMSEEVPSTINTSPKSC